jgi:uncharacterized membrane protein YozB (DUF420 family)
MAHATTPAPAGALIETGKATLIAKSLAWVGIVGLAVGFVLKYVFHYYLHYDKAAFDPYWPRRAGLLLHISGGMLALLTGPWQFWTGLRQKHMQVHRWTGRLFLLGATMGVIGATYLAFTTTYGWAFGTGLLGLACAWASTCGMAYYAIRRGLVQIHKEWMIRAYVVTYAFVTFRVFSDYGPISRLQPVNDLSITLSWACWVVPLCITELVMQFRRMRKAVATGAS